MKLALTAIVIFTLLSLLAFGLPVVEVVKANFLPKEIPTPPPIIIHSPLNTTYNQNDILLNFTIVGISHWWTVGYHVTNLYYEIDGKSVNFYVYSHINTEQYSTNITGLAKGEHTLIVHANASGIYRNNYPNSGTAQYFIESTQTVSFIIDKELENTPSSIVSSSPTMTPSQSSIPSPTRKPIATSSLYASGSAASILPSIPTQEPTMKLSITPTPSITVDKDPIEQIYFYIAIGGIALAIALVTINIIAVVYFKKIKK